jgi:hypothetical protein
MNLDMPTIYGISVLVGDWRSLSACAASLSPSHYADIQVVNKNLAWNGLDRFWLGWIRLASRLSRATFLFWDGDHVTNHL